MNRYKLIKHALVCIISISFRLHTQRGKKEKRIEKNLEYITKIKRKFSFVTERLNTLLCALPFPRGWLWKTCPSPRIRMSQIAHVSREYFIYDRSSIRDWSCRLTCIYICCLVKSVQMEMKSRFWKWQIYSDFLRCRLHYRYNCKATGMSAVNLVIFLTFASMKLNLFQLNLFFVAIFHFAAIRLFLTEIKTYKIL